MFLGYTFTGRTHDYKMLKAELSPELDWFVGLSVLVDLGYLGIQTDYKVYEKRLLESLAQVAFLKIYLATVHFFQTTFSGAKPLNFMVKIPKRWQKNHKLLDWTSPMSSNSRTFITNFSVFSREDCLVKKVYGS